MHLEKKFDYFNLDSNLWLLDMQAKRAQTAKKNCMAQARLEPGTSSTWDQHAHHYTTVSILCK